MGKISKGNAGAAFLSFELFVRVQRDTYGYDTASDAGSTLSPMSATSM